MHRSFTVLLASAALVTLLADSAWSQQVRRAEPLRGANENPPVVTDGSGNFRARLFQNRIEYRLRYDIASEETASDATAAHLHVANPGNNGGIVAFLCANSPPDGVTTPTCPESPGVVEGEIVADDVLEVSEGDPAVTVVEAGDLDALARLIRQGAVYANVHSNDHPAGEVRGQLSPRIR